MGPLVGREAGGEASNGPWGEAWRRGCVGALWNTSVCWTCACGRREAGTGLWGEASCREETEGDLEADQKTQPGLRWRRLTSVCPGGQQCGTGEGSSGGQHTE